MSNEKQSTIQFPYQIVTPVLLVAMIIWNYIDTLKYWKNQLLTNWIMISSVLLGGSILLFAIVATLKWYYRYRAIKELMVSRLTFPSDLTAKAKRIDPFLKEIHQRHRKWYKRLFKGREWFGSLIYVNDQNEIEWYFLYPQDKQNGVQRTVKSYFPGMEFYEVKVIDLPLPIDIANLYGGSFALNNQGKKAGMPLQTFEESQIGSILTHMAPKTWLFLRFSPTLHSRGLERSVKKALKNLGMSTKELESMFKIEMDHPEKKQSSLTPTEKARYKSLFQKHTGREKPFDVALSLWSENEYASSIVQDTKSSIEQVMEFDNHIYMKIARFFKGFQCSLYPLDPIPWIRQRMLWTHSELANLFHFPSEEDRIYKIPNDNSRPYLSKVEAEQRSIGPTEFKEGFSVGLLDHPVQDERPVYIPYDIWTLMSFGTGQVGSGKSAFFLNLVNAHLTEKWYSNKNAPGLTFFDPKGKGEDALKIMAKINSDLHRMQEEGIDIEPIKKRIHYFDLSSEQHVLGLNLLHKKKGISHDAIVGNFMDLYHNAYAEEANSLYFDRLVPLAIHSLLLDIKQKHTVLGIEKLLQPDETFRNRILPNMRNTVFSSDWDDSTKKILKSGQGSLPIINRLSKFRYNTRIRRIFGHLSMSIKPLEWMDDGHIVIFNISGLSPEDRALAMGYIITQYHLQAQTRKKKSKVHLTLCDEFHHVQLPVVKKINALDRASGHAFIPLTQYAEQINKDIRDGFDGNIATYIACSQGAQAADTMQEMSRGSIDSKQIQNMKPLRAMVSTLNSQKSRVTFQVKIPPPVIYRKDGTITYFGPNKDREDRERAKAFQEAQVLCEELMQRDCTPVEKVDEEIKDYLSLKTILQESAAQKRQEEVKNENETTMESTEVYSQPETASAQDHQDTVSTGNDLREQEESNKEDDDDLFTPLY